MDARRGRAGCRLRGGRAVLRRRGSYGRAEAFLADWLDSRGIAPGSVTVGSKWGYTYTAAWKVEADTTRGQGPLACDPAPPVGRDAGDDRPHLVLYQIHSATPEGGVLDDRAVLDELARLRARGWKIGLSLTGPRQAEALERALK